MSRVSATLGRDEAKILRDMITEALDNGASTITINLISEIVNVNPDEEQEHVS